MLKGPSGEAERKGTISRDNLKLNYALLRLLHPWQVKYLQESICLIKS
jgi:hypothetical protein